jgi:hypothetical protein
MQDEIPQSVATAKQAITLLGDFSQMGEDEDIPSNIQAFSDLLISKGSVAFPHYC